MNNVTHSVKASEIEKIGGYEAKKHQFKPRYAISMVKTAVDATYDLLENILYSKVFSLKLMQTPIAIKSIKK